MSRSKENCVKILCVDVKAQETQDKLKAKVLRAIYNSEKKSSPTPITHPLQPWNEEVHTFLELKPEDVSKVVANSSHLTFLLRDGRVCRVRVASWEESSGKAKSIDALRQNQRGNSRFQVLGDAEYAQQLQAELNSGPGNWNIAGAPRRWSARPAGDLFLEVHGGGLTSPMHPAVLDDNALGSRWRTSIVTGPVTLFEDTQDSSLLMDNLSNLTSRTSGRRGGAKGERSKGSKSWPEMGSVEWLVMKQNPENPNPDTSFIAMAAMHSEILLVSSKERRLYSWACAGDSAPQPHPLTEELGLEGERVGVVGASDIRATVVTESGKVATFYDSLLRMFPELEGEKVAHLSVSNFLTCAVTVSGKVFWWGLCPRSKSTPSTPSSSSSHTRGSSTAATSAAATSAPSGATPTSRTTTITDGSLVRLKNGPPCGPNAIVFNYTGPKPRVGKTMNIIEHSGLDPKTSILVKVFRDPLPTLARGTGLSRQKSLESEACFDGLEVWSLSDVVYLDDSPSILGRVVTVDQLQAIVDISHSSSEAGTMGSTSGAQSTLKVFKLTEIESCMERGGLGAFGGGRGTPQQQQSEAAAAMKGESPSKESGSKVAVGVTVSQHIAGIVQHRPACLLSPSHPTSQPHPPERDSPCTCIHGYYPLAVQVTDNGPIMLVKRLSDDSAFLVCSGHSGFPSFSNSSFVSLSSRDSKPRRVTIEEESVSAASGGLDRQAWLTSSSPGEGTGQNTANKELNGDAVNKELNGDSKGLTEERKGLKIPIESVSHPSFTRLHKSDAIVLQDSNGIVCPLSGGLNLRPSSLPEQHQLLGQGGGRRGPVQPYKCIASRFHWVKKDCGTLIVVLVPEPQQLMPAVLTGDTATVDKFLTRLQAPKETTHTSDQRPTPASEPKSSQEVEQLTPPRKRAKISNLVPESAWTTAQQGGVYSASSAKSCDVSGSDSPVGVAAGGCGRDVLQELTEQNNNILHVCCHLDTGKGKDCPNVTNSKSVSSSYLGSSTVVRHDKSFEELRYEYLQENPSLTLKGAESGCLSVRLLWILRRMLDCEQIRPVVIELLCSCNREGHTPFLTAVCSQNYAAALRILTFVELVSPDQPNLFDRAILNTAAKSPSSTIHHLLGSLSVTFDLRTMALYVHNLHLSTAKQLLRLFQVRYPSAYKAEIVKRGLEKGGSEASESSSDESAVSEQDVQELLSIARADGYTQARNRRPYHNLPRRRLARSRDPALSHIAHHGLVYFSDVRELRAAAQEMNGFRIVSSLSRNTGFGATQTISYLTVSLEPPSDSLDDGDAFPFLIDRGGVAGHMTGAGASIYDIMGGTGSGSGREATKKKQNLNKLSSQALARQLLHKLLSYPSLVTSLDPSGETVLASIAHNPSCIDSLVSLSPIPSAEDLPPSPSNPPAVATTSEGRCEEVQGSHASAAGAGKGLFVLPKAHTPTSIQPYVNLGDGLSSEVELKALTTPTDSTTPLDQVAPASVDSLTLTTPPDPASQEMDCAPSPTHKKVVDFFTSQLLCSNLGGVAEEGVASEEDGSLTDRVRSAVASALGSVADEIRQDVMEKVDREFLDQLLAADQSSATEGTGEGARGEMVLDKGSSVFPPSLFKRSPPAGISSSFESNTTTSSTAAPSSSNDTVLQKPLLFGKGSSLSSVRLDSLQIASSSSLQSDASLTSFSAVDTLFSNWPAIVTTVLGFCPAPFGDGHAPCDSGHTPSVDSHCTLSRNEHVHDHTPSVSGHTPFGDSHTPSPSKHTRGHTPTGHDHTPSSANHAPSCRTGHTSCPAPQFSSVHLLDSFTTDLMLNCPNHIIQCFVNTIVERMNLAVAQLQGRPGDETGVKLFVQEMDFSDPEAMARFLNEGEAGVAVLVGRRFLASVIRVLSLEHSRVKNRFLEMQRQARQDDAEGTAGVPLTAARATNSATGNSSGTSQANRKPSVTPVISDILSRYSWLAVHSLSQAAEACASPVRLGVSKPLGASSVVAEYQSHSRGGYSMGNAYTSLTGAGGRQGQRQGQGLLRQLHVRAARMSGVGAKRDFQQSALPSEGVFLQPNLVGGEAGSSGLSRVGLNTSAHNESSDEELEQHMETAGAHTDDEHTHVDTTATLTFPIDPTSPPYSTQIHNGVFLDLDSTSSSDDNDYVLLNRDYLGGAGWVGEETGGANEEDNVDNVYMYAWALDGRRIGESGATTTGRSASPTSINDPIIFSSTHEPAVPLASIPSIRFGAGFLARTFARFVKDLVDVALEVSDKQQTQPSLQLPASLQHQLVSDTIHTLEQTWRWAVCLLDMAEGQLQQGQKFDVQRHVVSLRGWSSQQSTSGRSSHSSRASRSFIGSTPGEYVVSLLRSRDHEDKDCLPVLDLYGYEHVVYVLDGLLYTLSHWPRHLTPHSSDQSDHLITPTATPTPTSQDRSKTISEDISDSPRKSKKLKLDTKDESDLNSSKFFKRTESVLVAHENDSSTQLSNDRFFGINGGASLALENPELVGPPNQWGKQVESFSRPLHEEYPLASRPHLLKPFARKEALFGGGDSVDGGGASERGAQSTGGHRKEGKKGRKRRHSSPANDHSSSPLTMMWSVDHAHHRWRSAISVFAHIFLAEGPGNERSNFLNAHAGFASRMARFRHQVAQLYDAAQVTRDWAGTVSSTLSIRVRRDRLMQDALHTLQQLSQFHYSNVRVKFDGEDGSGPGVNRGFFASLSNELKSSDVSKNPLNRLGLVFHEPGKQPEQSGLFAPHPFMPHLISSPTRATAVKAQRKDAFMAIGRFFGLCLWFHYTIPFMVCRHVAKVLLGRTLAWHDLAFYNADLYEGLRQMMLDAEEGKKDNDEFLATYCSYFEAPLPGKFVEPVLVDLIPGGSKVAVSPSRVQEYVRLYSMFMMVGCVQEELEAMKRGLNDIIPNDLLSGLTAEDFQLLLSGGSADITLTRLKSIIRFNHTHGSSRTICDRFEKMFWRVVSHMTNTQRQQLLYFATGSAALPASVDNTNRVPSVAITLDVIGSRNPDSLPVASTCSQRMCVPLYPSYHVLKKKLLQAIQCQAYGLG